MLCDIAESDYRFKVVDLSKNFGKHCALMAGFSFDKGELIVIMDDDYQCPAGELWKMVDAIDVEGYDFQFEGVLIFLERIGKLQCPFLRGIINAVVEHIEMRCG